MFYCNDLFLFNDAFNVPFSIGFVCNPSIEVWGCGAVVRLSLCLLNLVDCWKIRSGFVLSKGWNELIFYHPASSGELLCSPVTGTEGACPFKKRRQLVLTR